MKSLKGEKGFTLLEAIASLAILSIGLIAVVESFSHSIQANSYTQGLTIATFLAEEKMAEIETTTQTTSGTSAGDFGDNYSNYRWEIKTNDTKNEKILEAIVSVFWKEKEKEKKIEMITQLPRKPIAGE